LPCIQTPQEGKEMFSAIAAVLIGVVGIVYVKRRSNRKKSA
jgi:hypothetical protein